MVARAAGDQVEPALAAALRDFVCGDLSRLPEIRRVLAPVRFWAETHVAWWPEGRLVYKPSRQNGNTPCNLWGWWDAAERRTHTGYPWPGGRAANIRGAGGCGIAEEEGRREIVAQTQYGEARRELPPGPPLLRVVLHERGLEVV